MVLFADVVLQFYLLEHLGGNEGDAIAWLEVALDNPHESLDHNGLSILAGMCGEDITHESEDSLADVPTQFEPFADLLAHSGVIFPVVVEIGVHEELECLEDLHIEVLAMLDQLEVLYTDVDIW